MKKNKIPQYLLILAGMVLGVAVGWVLVRFGGTEIVMTWIKPWGDIFIRMLKLIAIPLVLVSLITGVAHLGNIRSLSTLGLRTLAIYMATTLLAIMVGIGISSAVKPGSMVSTQSAQTLQQSYGVAADAAMRAETDGAHKPLQPIVDMFPDNMIGSMGNNQNMLQIIVIAILIGVAVLLIDRKKSQPVVELLESIEAIILKMVDIVMIFAPLGVFALMAATVAQSAGDTGLLGALGLYAVTVVAGMMIIIFVIYPLIIKIFTKTRTGEFFKKLLPVQLLAFSTSSSAATLPLTIETAVERMGISNRTARFVLPVGTTINMDGTSCYQAIVALFVAQVFGIDLGWNELLILLLTTTLSSIGTPGVPGGSMVIMVMVLGSVGIPVEGLALIIGLDRPLDMLRTVVNVTGDMTVAAVVDRYEKPKEQAEQNNQ